MRRRKRRKGRGLDKRDEGKTKKWGRRRGGREGCIIEEKYSTPLRMVNSD